MPSFEIRANGISMGIFEGETKVEAVDLYVRDAGYPTVQIAAETLGITEEQFLDQIEVIELDYDEAQRRLQQEYEDEDYELLAGFIAAGVPGYVLEMLRARPELIPAADKIAAKVATGELSPGVWLTNPESW